MNNSQVSKTNNTERNGVNKQKTCTHIHMHTANTQRKITLEHYLACTVEWTWKWKSQHYVLVLNG